MLTNWAYVLYIVLAGGVLFGLGALVNFLNKKAGESKYAKTFAQLVELVKSLVAHADAELRPEIQKALADGTLSPEEAKALKAKVLELAKASIGPSLSGLAKILGLQGGALDVFLSGLIEQAVASKKTANP